MAAVAPTTTKSSRYVGTDQELSNRYLGTYLDWLTLGWLLDAITLPVG